MAGSTVDVQDRLAGFEAQLEALRKGKARQVDRRPQWSADGTYTLESLVPRKKWVPTDERKPDGSPKYREGDWDITADGAVKCDVVLQVTDNKGRSDGHVKLVTEVPFDDLSDWQSTLGQEIELVNPRVVLNERTTSKVGSTFTSTVYECRFEHDGFRLGVK